MQLGGIEDGLRALVDDLRQARAEHEALSRRLAGELERSRALSRRLAENWGQIHKSWMHRHSIARSPDRTSQGRAEAATRLVMRARSSSMRRGASARAGTLEEMGLKAWDWAARHNGRR